GNRTGRPPTADRRRLRLRRRVRRAGALACNVLLHGVHEPRLAQSRLADDEHDLAHALQGLFPAIFEQADLVIAPGQRRQADGQSDVDGGARTALTLDAVDRDRLRGALDLVSAQAFTDEVTVDQALGGAGAHDGAGF